MRRPAAGPRTHAAPTSTDVRARGRRPRAPGRPLRGLRAESTPSHPRMLRDLAGATAARSGSAPASRRGPVSARGHARILRVARTIADLEGSSTRGEPDHHVHEAPPLAGYRTRLAARDERPRKHDLREEGPCDACLRRTEACLALARAARSDVAVAHAGPPRARSARGSPTKTLLGLSRTRRAPQSVPTAAFRSGRRPRRGSPSAGSGGLSAGARPGYPPRLRELPDPPAVLHLAGDADAPSPIPDDGGGGRRAAGVAVRARGRTRGLGRGALGGRGAGGLRHGARRRRLGAHRRALRAPPPSHDHAPSTRRARAGQVPAR